MAEVWFRNPKDYARELAEVGESRLAWDRGMLIKRNIDPFVHGNLYFGNSWTARLIGTQGTVEIDPEHPMLRPAAVYPTWSYGEPSALLEEMISNPVGQSEAACFDLGTQVDERPVWGQKHVVVIAEGPPGGGQTSIGRKYFRWLSELQDDYPECELYVHGLYGFRLMFGLGFRAIDADPRTDAQKGNIMLPSGKISPFEEGQKNPKWLMAVGMSVEDIKVPRNRCIFNIRSLVWAGENYAKIYKFKLNRQGQKVDTVTPQIDYKPDGTRDYLIKAKHPQAGDYIACDSCSLKDACKYEREGAVCSVPNSDGSKLAKYFRTRDSQNIIDGLTEIMALGATRVESAIEEEEVMGLDPQVTAMLNSLFAQGMQLAKLVDPSLRSGPKVNVNVGVGAGGSAQVEAGNPKAIIAGVVRQFELEGVPRDKITPEMIEGALAGMASPETQRRAIRGQVIGDE